MSARSNELLQETSRILNEATTTRDEALRNVARLFSIYIELSGIDAEEDSGDDSADRVRVNFAEVPGDYVRRFCKLCKDSKSEAARLLPIEVSANIVDFGIIKPIANSRDSAMRLVEFYEMIRNTTKTTQERYEFLTYRFIAVRETNDKAAIDFSERLLINNRHND